MKEKLWFIWITICWIALCLCGCTTVQVKTPQFEATYINGIFEKKVDGFEYSHAPDGTVTLKFSADNKADLANKMIDTAKDLVK